MISGRTQLAILRGWIVGLASAMAAGAQAQVGEPASTISAPGSEVYYLLRALGSLAIVIGLILLTYYVLRRYSWGRPALSEPGPMRIIQTLSVEPGRRLHLLQVGSRAFVVAWTAESATLIGELDLADLGDRWQAVVNDVGDGDHG